MNREFPLRNRLFASLGGELTIRTGRTRARIECKPFLCIYARPLSLHNPTDLIFHRPGFRFVREKRKGGAGRCGDQRKNGFPWEIAAMKVNGTVLSGDSYVYLVI